MQTTQHGLNRIRTPGANETGVLRGSTLTALVGAAKAGCTAVYSGGAGVMIDGSGTYQRPVPVDPPIEWVRVAKIYDDAPEADPPLTRHEDYGRGLGIVVQQLIIPTNGDEDLSWEDKGGEIFAFPDPIQLHALNEARDDPDGLGEAIHLDDYFHVDKLYKAIRRGRFFYVSRDQYALFGGPEYEDETE